MSGRISSFFVSIPQQQNRLKYSPVAKVCQAYRLLKKSLLQAAQKIQGEAREPRG
jgi:hypothetical protein